MSQLNHWWLEADVAALSDTPLCSNPSIPPLLQRGLGPQESGCHGVYSLQCTLLHCTRPATVARVPVGGKTRVEVCQLSSGTAATAQSS